MPRNTSSLTARAMQCLHKNAPAEAKTLATKACKQNKRDVKAWEALAAASARLGQMKDVADACRMMVELQPTNPVGHYNLGVACQAMQNLDEAEKCYRKTLNLHPDHTAAATSLGTALIARKQAQEAIELFERVLSRDNENALAHRGLGIALRDRGQLDQSLACLRRSLELAPEAADTHYNLGLVFAEKNQYPQAQESFANAIRLNADHVEAICQLSRLLIDSNRYEEAEARLLHAISRNPKHATIRFLLGNAYYLQDKFARAKRCYQEGLALEPDDFAALNNLGRIYQRLGQYDDAIRLFRDALKHGKQDSVIYCNIGDAFKAQRNWPMAARQYREAIALSPDQFEPYLGLGQVLCEMDAIEDAIAALRKTVELKPDMPLARHLLTSLEKDSTTDTSDADYVMEIFDKYADHFDTDLVGNLEYKAPEEINRIVRENMDCLEPRLQIMDIGCGTGLCGPLLRDMASRLDGIDLSARMIEKARERGVYDDLHVGEITAVLKSSTATYDLIIAADVFIYIGDLVPVMRACANVLPAGGLMAFSVESCDGDGYRLLSSGRHAHSESYVAVTCASQGIELINSTVCDIRLEHGSPVTGIIFLGRKCP